MPNSAVYAPSGPGYVVNPPIEGSNQLKLIPPDFVHQWRFREMQVLKLEVYENGYSVISGNYTVPPKAPPVQEILVIWERYEENS